MSTVTSTDRTDTITRPLAVHDGLPPPAVIDELAWLLRGRRVAVLTGAGISTDSGIPDYRGPNGSLKRRSPITYAEFTRSAAVRQRYWARSCVGWPFMSSRNPNAAHRSVAALQEADCFGGLITQNVDGLHQAAGSTELVELHGALSTAICLQCGHVISRDQLQVELLKANPGWLERTIEAAPDGDAEIPEERTRSFRLVPCDRCGGELKPNVVLFGERVPKTWVEQSFRIVDEHEVLLVLGSSLKVFSGYRFAQRASQDQKPVVIINQGPTRADDIAAFKVSAPLSLVLPALEARLMGRANE